MIPAITIPKVMAMRPRITGASKAQRANDPVHAPVKGRGIATNRTIPQKLYLQKLNLLMNQIKKKKKF